MTILRYEIIAYPHETEPFGEVRIENELHPNGGWVRWSDIEVLFAQEDVDLLNEIREADGSVFPLQLSETEAARLFALRNHIQALLPSRQPKR